MNRSTDRRVRSRGPSGGEFPRGIVPISITDRLRSLPLGQMDYRATLDRRYRRCKIEFPRESSNRPTDTFGKR